MFCENKKGFMLFFVLGSGEIFTINFGWKDKVLVAGIN